MPAELSCLTAYEVSITLVSDIDCETFTSHESHLKVPSISKSKDPHHFIISAAFGYRGCGLLSIL